MFASRYPILYDMAQICCTKAGYIEKNISECDYESLSDELQIDLLTYNMV